MIVTSAVVPHTPLPRDNFVGTINDTPAGSILRPETSAIRFAPPVDVSVTPRTQGAPVPADVTAEWKVVHATMRGPSFTPSVGTSCAFAFLHVPTEVGAAVVDVDEVLTASILAAFVYTLSVTRGPRVVTTATDSGPPDIDDVIQLDELVH